MKKKKDLEDSTKRIQKQEKIATSFIIIVSIFIGILIAFILAGLL